jgi:hypothetical protein
VATDQQRLGHAAGSLRRACRAFPPRRCFKRDLDDFLHHFARAYFEIVSSAIHASDPNHLYLGCRFAAAPIPWSAPLPSSPTSSASTSTAQPSTAPRSKPWETGHHRGVSLRRNRPRALSPRHQRHPHAGRARCGLHAYINSAAKCPAVVGAHWFQFIDEPITGRWHDGENYNIGFVDVTDTPYPELTSAATATNGEIYTLRGTP